MRSINAEHGYELGDQVLRAVAAELSAGKGIVARIAGDEFAVLLEDCSAAQASAIAERHRARLAQFELAPRGAIPVRISCGVSGWIAGDTIDGLLKRAQAALELAKRRDGDCVVTVDRTEPGRNAAR